MVIFGFKDGVIIQGFEEKLAGDFQLAKTGDTGDRRVYYDTFNWGLFRKGLLLYHTGNYFYLVKQKGEEPVCGIEGYRRLRPFSLSVLPECALKQKLKQLVRLRALIPLNEYNYTSREYLSGETGCRLGFKSYFLLPSPIGGESPLVRRDSFLGDNTAGEKADFRFIVLQGDSPGYEKLEDVILGEGLEPLSVRDMYRGVLKHDERSPGDYTTKPFIPLDPGGTGAAGFKQVFLVFLNIMDRNVPGILRDIDTEFLHDYRVSIRRIRSLASHAKGVLPRELLERLKKDFTILGTMSNDLRDLDVYLLNEREYISLLPRDIGRSLSPFFEKLKEKRKEAFRKLCDFLKGEEYAGIYARWKKIFSGGDSGEEAAGASLSLEATALKIIGKRIKKILKTGARISPGSPGEDIHRLRIQFKKLRYLLLFFKSLLPQEELAYMEKQLKGIQENLGTFNDLDVQLSYLKESLAGLDMKESVLLSTALGDLIVHLNDRQTGEKDKFFQTYKTFHSRENIALIEALFRIGK